MNIYFVRHGQSEDNISKVFSSPDTPLSEIGKKQAAAVEDQCSPLPVDIIISSDLKRTKQTAEIINQTQNKEIVFTELLREGKHPSEVVGKKHMDPENQKIMDEIRANASDRNWHYSDEENFFEFRDRLVKALEFVVARKEENVIVVTHSNAMKMIMSIILHGKDAPPGIFYQLSKILTTKNTGITFVHHHNDGRWELFTWNNYTHITQLPSSQN